MNWQKGNPSSDSNENSGSESDEDKKQVQKKQGKKKWSFSDEDSDEEEKRTAQSKQAKVFASLKETTDKIKQLMKNSDLSKISDLFVTTQQQLEKQKNIIDKNGIPRFFIRLLVRLDMLIKNFPKEELKSNKLKQNSHQIIKKQLKKLFESYQADIDKFIAQPTATTDEEQENKAEQAQDNKKKDKKQKKEAGSDSESWGDQQSDTSSDPGDKQDRTQLPLSERRKFWLKPKSDDTIAQQHTMSRDEVKKFREDQLKIVMEGFKEEVEGTYRVEDLDEEMTKDLETYLEMKVQNYLKKRVNDEEDEKKQEEWKQDVVARFREKIRERYRLDPKAKEFVPPDVTPAGYLKKMQEIIENRTKGQLIKGFYDDLTYYLNHFAEVEVTALEVTMVLLPVRIDLGKIQSPTYLKSELWQENYKSLEFILSFIKKNQQVTIRQFVKDEAGQDLFYQRQQLIETLSTNTILLEAELQKAFRNLEFTDKLYSEKLTDLYEFLKIAKHCQEFLETESGNEKTLRSLSMRRLENLYFMSDELLAKLRLRQGSESKDQCFEEHDSQKRIKELYERVVQADENEGNKLKATLYLIYHHAIHDRFDIARDILLMSHAQESIVGTDINFQSLFNRAIVQIGLSAFRLGKIKEAHRYLKDIFMQKKERIRELLLQNISRYPDSVESSRKRALPYHVHINIDYVETVNYIIGMLIEIPEIVQEQQGYLFNKNKRIKSTFKQLIDSFQYVPSKYSQSQFQSTRHLYNGPSESSIELIWQASKFLKQGLWEKCYQLLSKISNLRAIGIKDTLLKQIKISALKSYLFLYKDIYSSINIQNLEQQFRLDFEDVKNVVFKFVQKKRLQASIVKDGDHLFLVFADTVTSELQDKSIKIIDRVTAEQQQNELIIDNKIGCYGHDKKEEVQVDFSKNPRQRQNKVRFWNQQDQKKFQNKGPKKNPIR